MSEKFTIEFKVWSFFSFVTNTIEEITYTTLRHNTDFSYYYGFFFSEENYEFSNSIIYINTSAISIPKFSPSRHRSVLRQIVINVSW